MESDEADYEGRTIAQTAMGLSTRLIQEKLANMIYNQL